MSSSSSSSTPPPPSSSTPPPPSSSTLSLHSSNGGADLTPSCSTVRFLVSYGGTILPLYPDGRLRYVGGDTRLLVVPRSSLPFSELMKKMEELCGPEKGAILRCQLPGMDLDELVTVRSDDDLLSLMEDCEIARSKYCRLSHVDSLKIRAFLFYGCPQEERDKTKSPLSSPTHTSPPPPPPPQGHFRRQNSYPTHRQQEVEEEAVAAARGCGWWWCPHHGCYYPVQQYGFPS